MVSIRNFPDDSPVSNGIIGDDSTNNDNENHLQPDDDMEYMVDSPIDPFKDDNDSDKDPDYIPAPDDIADYVTLPQVHQNNEQIENEEQDLPNKKLSRKRKRCPEKWKRNVKKNQREHGKEYENWKGIICEKKQVQPLKNSHSTCKLQCHKKISHDERQKINTEFWILSDEGKQHFYNKNTKRIPKKRTTTKSGQSRRSFTYTYYFNIKDELIQVCKSFFLSTLNISQRRISYFHENKREETTGNPIEIQKGKHIKKKISEERRQSVFDHINSIPRIESHYCRQRSKKEYFESGLNLNKLYDLYTEWCQERYITPVKVSYYRNIFNFEFNISFWKPKSDRCDICEENKMKKCEDQDQSTNFERHLQLKRACYENRQKDRGIEPARDHAYDKIGKGRSTLDQSTAIICFDMENVFALPKAGISCFFYSNKLNCYNMTAHCNLNGRAYCAVWSEGIHGRKGSDIASALIKILETVLEDFPDVNKLILWSDSCVPQNRNSIMTLGLKKFLEEHPTIKEIVQKFSEPGHGQVQEVDNIHSQIEKKLEHLEIYSPLGLLRALKSVNNKKPFRIIQLQLKDFKDYENGAKVFNFTEVPYCTVRQLKYKQDEPFMVYYKLDYSDDTVQFNAVRITYKTRSSTSNMGLLPTIKIVPQPTKCLLTEDKVYHLYKLFKFIPKVDKAYLKTLFYEYKDEKNVKKLAKKKIAEEKELKKGKNMKSQKNKKLQQTN